MYEVLFELDDYCRSWHLPYSIFGMRSCPPIGDLQVAYAITVLCIIYIIRRIWEAELKCNKDTSRQGARNSDVAQKHLYWHCFMSVNIQDPCKTSKWRKRSFRNLTPRSCLLLVCRLVFISKGFLPYFIVPHRILSVWVKLTNWVTGSGSVYKYKCSGNLREFYSYLPPNSV